MTKPVPAAISVDMGGTKIYGMLNRFDGDVLVERILPTHENESDSGFDQLVRLIDQLRTEGTDLGVDIRGIGLGVPGMTDGGRVVAAPALGWNDEPVAERLRERFGLPVVLENDVNLAALGEYGFGVARGAASLICVAVGTGIGAGIVINGTLYRGAHHSAGEIGYLTIDPAQFSSAFSNADFGAFEQLASGSGIEARARHHLSRQGRDSEAIGVEAVVAAATAGEGWAEQVIDETVMYLALGLTSVTAVLDPEVIVLSGGVMNAPQHFVEPIRAHMRRLIPFQPRIVVSTLGPRATALGATVLLASQLAQTLT